MTRLEFKQQVLLEEKELLGRYAAHLSSVHSETVRNKNLCNMLNKMFFKFRPRKRAFASW